MEDEALGLDEALARGFARFVKFLGVSKLDATARREPRLAPVRMLFPANRRKLSRKGRLSRRMLGFPPGFFAQFDCTPLICASYGEGSTGSISHARGEPTGQKEMRGQAV
jgi:hypothetical protein